jgi:hypothetical protein
MTRGPCGTIVEPPRDRDARCRRGGGPERVRDAHTNWSPPTLVCDFAHGLVVEFGNVGRSRLVPTARTNALPGVSLGAAVLSEH